jgi:hypothetical protein
MVRKIALTSTGPLSGKSTLARHLEKEYGFIRADHSLTVVTAFVENWNDPLPYSSQTSVEQVYQEKEQWRELLQQFSYTAGFNDPTHARDWMIKTLARSGCTVTQARCPGARPSVCPDRDVVFDNFRGEVQAEALRGLGFELVQIRIQEWTRQERAAKMGVDYNKVLANAGAAPELEGGIERPDIFLNGDQPVEVLGRILVHRPAELGGYIIFGSQIRG